MGYLISIEGPDGSGKSTVISAIERFFAGRGVTVLMSREPGGVGISEQIRSLLLSFDYSEMDARTEALLFAAARRQHYVEKLVPALEQGRVVVLDRFIDSSIAYQGYGRKIGAREVEMINDFAVQGYRPDLTILLDVDADVALNRISADSEREINKLDREPKEFHERVRNGYLKIAAAPENRERIRVVDASADLADVVEQVEEVLRIFVASHARMG